MRGLILAAGRGSRLGDYNGGTPKCLIEVARRRMIEHQLEALAECGAAPVAVVVGYAADEVREAVGIRAQYVHNLRWEQTNSMVSFWLAREWFTDSVVVMNCDVLFHPEILARLLKVKGDAIAYDSTSGQAPEHMKVRVQDGRLMDMSKDMPAAESAGENVGVLVFTAETAQAIAARAEALIAAGHEKSWLGQAVREVAKERHIHAVDIAGMPWGEIDSAYDLEHVRHNVWPRIAKSRSSIRRFARVATVPVLFALVLSLFGYRWLESPVADTAWDTIDLRGAEPTQLAIVDRTQKWWSLPSGARAEADVTGPETLRLESRLRLDVETAGTPYALKLELDGKVIDLVKHVAAADPDLPSGATRVAKRKRIEIEVPRGAHTLAVSLIGVHDGAGCLVRVREKETEPEPDSEATSVAGTGSP